MKITIGTNGPKIIFEWFHNAENRYGCGMLTTDDSSLVSSPCLTDAEFIELRDMLNKAYPPESKGGEEPEWRADGEWTEVTLSDARPGDVAEFKDVDGENYAAGSLTNDENSRLVILDDDFLIGTRHHPFGRWVIRSSSGENGGCMTDLHIWRRTDRSEPTAPGFYVTAKGTILYRDHDADGFSWTIIGSSFPYGRTWARWSELLDWYKDELPISKGKEVAE